MWAPSHRHLCLIFLLACVFACVFFLLIHQNLFHSGLDLFLLCPDRSRVTSPVAILCLSGTPVNTNATFSCPKHPASVSGTWTIDPKGRFGNQMGQYATLLALAQLNGRQAFIQPSMHAVLAPVFRITLPVLAPEVDRHAPWQELELHDWMLEEYAHVKEPWVKLTGFPCSWTFFHHLREQIRVHPTRASAAGGAAFAEWAPLPPHRGPPEHLRGCPRAPRGLPTSDASPLEGCGGGPRLPPTGYGLVPGPAQSPHLCGH